MTVVWTRQARARLAAIEDYIAQDDPEAAARWTNRLVQRTKALGAFPESGRRIPERATSLLREVVVGNYRIVYRVGAKRIEVLTVFEGHHLLPSEDLPLDDLPSDEG